VPLQLKSALAPDIDKMNNDAIAAPLAHGDRKNVLPIMTPP